MGEKTLRGGDDGGRRTRQRGRNVGVDFGYRGQTTTLEYTLTLALGALVVVTLVVGAGEFVTDQREQVVRTELNVVGQQLAGDIVAADRLAQAGESTETVELTSDLPATVAGTGYNVAVDTSGPTQRLVLTSTDPEVEVSLRVRTTTTLEPGGVSGGELTVVYDGTNLEVER